jgi:hypothetical protein
MTRVLFIVVLLAGIVTMHAVAIVAGHDSAHTAITSGHPQMSAAAHAHTGGAGRSCPGDGCGNLHSAFHACVFIMSVVTFVVGLAMLCWIGIDRAQHGLSKLGGHGRRRQRAPPWTVLSLPELSILRI